MIFSFRIGSSAKVFVFIRSLGNFLTGENQSYLRQMIAADTSPDFREIIKKLDSAAADGTTSHGMTDGDDAVHVTADEALKKLHQRKIAERRRNNQRDRESPNRIAKKQRIKALMQRRKEEMVEADAEPSDGLHPEAEFSESFPYLFESTGLGSHIHGFHWKC